MEKINIYQLSYLQEELDSKDKEITELKRDLETKDKIIAVLQATIDNQDATIKRIIKDEEQDISTFNL